MPELGTIWFVLVGVLLTGYAILDGFDLGAGILHPFVARTDDERQTVFGAIGPVWDGNEVWLLTAGGALFAAFPAVYATVFSGFYLAMMLVLVALIFRAIAIEFRSKEEGARWRAVWDWAFALSSFLAALLFGVAMGNILRGIPLDPAGDYRGGLIGLLNPFSLLVGLLAVAMFVVQGATWLVLRTEGELRERSRLVAEGAWVVLIVLWLAATAAAFVDAAHLQANFDHVVAWLAPLAFVVLTVAYRWQLSRGHELTAFGLSSGSVAALMAIVGASLYPNLVPALGDPGASLTVANSASSDLTLGVMLVIALVGMPLVIIYSAFVYSRFRGKVRLSDHY